MPERPEIKSGGVPFEEAARFFRDKVRLPTKKWTDIRGGMHARAFVVAGATKDELLKDLQGAIQKAMDDGTGLAQFRKDFDRIVAAHGWTGWTGEGTKKGRAWRTRVIFETNLSTARAAGRWEQIQRLKHRRPFLRYVAILDDHVRPDHRRWHGTVLPVDDEWWQTHYPPNGWNCRCTVMSLSKMQLADFGYEPSSGPPREDLVRKPDPFRGGVLALDRGIDPGFNYNVGEAHVGLVRDVPEGYAATRDEWKPLEGGAYKAFGPADYGSDAPLEAKPLPVPLGEPASGRAELIDEIERAIGGSQAVLEAPGGAGIQVDARLLGEHIDHRRAPFVPLIPDLIRNPQEVWLIFERNERTGQVALRRRHVTLYETEDKDRPVLMVFQALRGIFEAWTFLVSRSPSYIERYRHGLRIWPPGRSGGSPPS